MFFILRGERYFVRACSRLNAGGSGWIALLMMLIVADIIGRGLFNYPVIGTPEIVKLSLVIIVFLQLAYVLSQGRHIRTTILHGRLSLHRQEMLNVLASIIGAALFFFVIKSSWPLVVSAVELHEYEMAGFIHVTVIPTRIVVLFGSVLVFIQFVFNFLISLDRLVHRKGTGGEIRGP